MENSQIRKFVSSMLLTVTSCSLPGCVVAAAGAGAAAGVGTYAYVTGKLTATVDAPLDRTYDATLGAVSSLQFGEKTKEKDVFQAKIIARTAGDKDVTIYLRKLSENATELSIRVGTFGDEEKSVAVYDEIKKHL